MASVGGLESGSRMRGMGGFTLVELLVVLVVLGIVASLALVALFSALDKSKQRATMADMRSISKAIDAYNIDNGFLPDGSGGIATLATVLVPYQISTVPTQDHWGHAYAYATAGSNYTLESFGKDGTDGVEITTDTRMEFERDILLSNGQFIAAPE